MNLVNKYNRDRIFLKTGIITFHWGTNYGGILQAYALQEFIKKLGCEAEIINYAPLTFRDSFFRCFRTKSPRAAIKNFLEYIKEQHFIFFRKKYLITTKRFFTLEELQNEAPKMDVYITGSDQVWNSFFLNSYGAAYFLAFGSSTVKRISYAASFGNTTYPNEAMEKIKHHLKKFDAISIRENSGFNILKDAGFDNAKLMPDPTLLLDKNDYDRIMINKPKRIKEYAFFYILQKNQCQIEKVYNHVRHKLKIKTVNTTKLNTMTMGISDWLINIRDSQFVVTNSFHGVIFSIIFRKQFIVLPVEGALAGMNDRIYTLLQKFGLKDRIIETFEETKFLQILDKQIDWKEMRKIQKNLQKEAFDYLKESIYKV